VKRAASHRDVTGPGAATHWVENIVADGRRVIAGIGIDRYRAWNRLRNAVADARGVLATFEDLGFEPVIEPLLDEEATGEAIRRLASDDLRPRPRAHRSQQVRRRRLREDRVLDPCRRGA
jgi:hypothetical protein